MPPVPILLKPGVDVQSTAALSAAGWNESHNIRFFQGLAQKAGGFTAFTEQVAGGGRPIALRAWTALSGINNLAIGSENRISLLSGNVVSDITPPVGYSVIPVDLTTLVDNQIVIVRDAVNTPAVGDWIRFRAPVSVGGVVLDGPYEVAVIGIPVGTYGVIPAVVPTATVANGGDARTFTTASGSRTVTLLLADNGTSDGDVIRITDPVGVGGLTLEGNYVVSVIDPDTYTIEAATPATSTATVTENNDNIALSLYAPADVTQNDLEVEAVSLDNWGEYLLAVPQGGPVYVWLPRQGPTPMSRVTTAPQANTYGFVSNQQQILVLGGSVNLSTEMFDPMLVRWSDAGDYEEFDPLPENQAGSFRLQYGSLIVAGLPGVGRNLIWTDLGLYAMQYEGPPLVWGFQPIGINCGLVGPNAFGALSDAVMWMSRNQFYVVRGGGTPQIIPCSVWDAVFKNADPAYLRRSLCATNSFFNEVSWYVLQRDGTTVKARLQIDRGEWDYTILEAGDLGDRAAASDQNVFGPPFGASPAGVVYQEETGRDADDGPLMTRLLSGIAMIAEGDQVAFIKGIVPDIKFGDENFVEHPGTLKMNVYVYRDPQSAPRIKGPYQINSRTRFVPCRTRGRGLQFEFFSDDLGSFWRVGKVSYVGQADGRGG